MRRIGLAVTAVATIPALALPLFAGVALVSVPAAVIAGIAAVAMPAHDARDARLAVVVVEATPRIVRR